MRVLEERPAFVPRSRACDMLGLNRSATYSRAPRRKTGPHKPQPRALQPAERAEILEVIGEDRYIDESIARIHARELSEGRVHASVSTMYRVARAERMTGERRDQRPPRRQTSSTRLPWTGWFLFGTGSSSWPTFRCRGRIAWVRWSMP
jgi:putative transposase